MALFQYSAVSPSGDALSGTIEASSAAEAIAKLQDAGNIPLSADPVGAAGAQGSLLDVFSSRGIGDRQMGMFTQQLATLLGAGLPLDRALQILVDLADGEKVKKMTERVRDRVRGGAALSQALEDEHGMFSRLYTNMVRAGETGGTLDATLAELSDYLSRSKELKDNVISALIYPAILLVMSVAALFILLIVVVPQFVPIFEEAGAELPLLTQMVLGIGTVLKDYWWLLALGAFGATVFMRSQMANRDSRLRWDAQFLKLKIIGNLLLQVDTARFARTLGTLLKNGVPMLGGLAIARNVVTNTVLAAGVEAATEEVKTGGALATALNHTKAFPKLAIQMVSVGEETGRLDEMLLRVANTYDREVKTSVDRGLSLLVPVLVLTLAAMIATIVFSVLIAILAVNDLVT
jgi:general secretion pathway protein F